MANLSTVDDLPNITANFSDDVYEHHETPYERIFLEVFTLVGLLSVTANILLSFVILKYKRLRRDATNKIFLQVNILQAVYLVATPLTLRVGLAFMYLSPVHISVFCVSYQIEFNVMFGIVWFIFLMICDWYLKVYHKNVYVKFCRVYKFFVVFVYVLVVLGASLTAQLCFRNILVLTAYLVMMALIALLVLILIVINIVHAIRKKRILVYNRRGNIGLAIANICFLCWLPGLIFIFINMGGIYINAPIAVIILFALGFSSPIFNLVYLYLYDDDYHIFLQSVFKCRCSDYTNETLDNRSVSYNDANGVEITA